MRTTLLCLALLCSFILHAQTKKKIDATAYNQWSTIRNYAISAKGNAVYYETSFLEGDGKLYFINKRINTTKHFPRAKRSTFANNDEALVFLIEPQYDTIRKLKLNETPKDKLPKDSLGVFNIDKDTLIKFADIKSFQVSEFGNVICFLSHKDLRPECPKETPSKKKKKKKNMPCERPSTSGTTLSILNTNDFSLQQKQCIVTYKLDQWSKSLLYVSSKKGKSRDTLSLHLYNLKDGSEKLLIENQFAIDHLCFDQVSSQLAFYASDDTNKLKNYNLYYVNLNEMIVNKIVDSLTIGMPVGYTVSEKGELYFNQKGSALFFGTNKIKRNTPKDTLLDSEKAKVDVWGANDKRIQPLQLAQLDADKNKSYTAVYHLASNKMIQIENEEIDRAFINSNIESDFVLAVSNEKYMREMSWMYPWKDDYYMINLNTGETTLLLESHAFRTSLSPSSKNLVYYNGADSSWYSLNTSTKKSFKMAGIKEDNFATDMNGMPSIAEDEGFYGWTKIADNEFCIVQSTNAVWLLSPQDKNLNKKIAITSAGKTSYYRTDYDSLYSDLSENYFVLTHAETKNQSLYKLNMNDFSLIKLIDTQHKIVSIDKAKNADSLLVRKMNFKDYPDLIFADGDFRNLQQISTCNPQQNEYNWGTVEQVSWKNYSGVELDGLLYKPEDFDSTKKYPMIVYFYEKYSDDIHNHYAPKPTASIVYPTEYVSNGYIVFIPDIVYEAGYPAKSAYNCIMSGTDHVIRNNNWVDSTKMGLQGQSWGGYQTAQLITMTNRFKAAMAGAPVSNMFSAYGGIRWTSGLSRQFQYERTQSRIGYTIWENPELYIANSPIFGLPNVQTPLLIMSNDGDGAVPWYQGIEMYMGLRRLNKPVWLLNYNGDEHNLMIHANRKDLSIRMRQFFDFYLMDAPMPVWMSTGVPAIEKGKNYGYDYVKP